MASLSTQLPQEPGFFGRLVQRIFQSRMQTALRVVKHHLQFLGNPTTIKPRPCTTDSAAHLLFAPASCKARSGCAITREDKIDFVMSGMPSVPDPIMQPRDEPM